MDPQTILVLVAGVMDIVRRHHAQTGEILTDDQVAQMLKAETAEGQALIAGWFASKGLELPK